MLNLYFLLIQVCVIVFVINLYFLHSFILYVDPRLFPSIKTVPIPTQSFPLPGEDDISREADYVFLSE
jgi:hypothetical protein